MSNIILSYQDTSISFTEDGWFNATAAAEKFNKRPVDWLALESTKEYLSVLQDVSGISEKSSLIRARRNSGTWFHPDLIVPFARWLDTRFSIWCDRQIKNILSGQHPHFDWKRLRHEASASHKVMNAVLQLVRMEKGKASKPYHYSNEAKLVNWALSGNFTGLDRNSLSAKELERLAFLEEKNAVLLGMGWTYAQRKEALSHSGKAVLNKVAERLA